MNFNHHPSIILHRSNRHLHDLHLIDARMKLESGTQQRHYSLLLVKIFGIKVFVDKDPLKFLNVKCTYLVWKLNHQSIENRRTFYLFLCLAQERRPFDFGCMIAAKKTLFLKLLATTSLFMI